METLFFYLLRVTIAATILYLFFKFILSKRTFHAINRIVVLSMVVMTLVLPLFTINLPEITLFQPKAEPATTPLTVEQVLALLHAGSYTNAAAVDSTPAVEIPWIKILGVIYLIGFAVALLRFVVSFVRMSRIIGSARKVRLDDGSLLCITDKKVSPFSWMQFVVLSQADVTDTGRDIIRHEQAHVGFGHSYDLLFLDLYTLVFWFNPFAWLLRLELQTVHEYQADEKVLAEGANAKEYHLSLIRQCVGEYKFALANNFEYNNLHKRIKMTMKTKSSSRQKWLYGTIGLSVILCVVVLSFNGLKAKAADLKELIQSELSAKDSAKRTTPSVVKTGEVMITKRETPTPQMVATDSVASDSKVKVRIGSNEDIRVIGYGRQKPLMIVDGEESAQDINPSDVDKIEVLKDAAATTLYGDKGRNGVILVTTKKHTTKEVLDESKIVIGGPNDAEWHKNQPLVLVFIDGKEASLNDVQAENIESVSVHKDFATITESMKAIKDTATINKFKHPGVNGVVFIKTKKK